MIGPRSTPAAKEARTSKRKRKEPSKSLNELDEHEGTRVKRTRARKRTKPPSQLLHQAVISTEMELCKQLSEFLDIVSIWTEQLEQIFNPKVWFLGHPHPRVALPIVAANAVGSRGRAGNKKAKKLVQLQWPTITSFPEPPSGVYTNGVVSTKVAKSAPSTSSYFVTDPFSMEPTPEGLAFNLQPSGFGLIQERIRGDLFAIVVQAVLWNQTTAIAGRPVLFKLLSTYPTAEAMALAVPEDVHLLIKRLGLQNRRSKLLIDIAKTWVASPPDPRRRYLRKGYPDSSNNKGKNGEPLNTDDPRPGYEIAHLPGIGPYALDSYRIFFRDTLRGIVPGSRTDPEWKRVIPADKDLRAYVRWMWEQEGWRYDIHTGTRTRIVPP